MPQPLSRRRFLRNAAVGGAMLAVPSVLVACGDDDDDDQSSSTGSPAASETTVATPGGKVRAAAAGAATDSLNVFQTNGMAQYTVWYNLYDSLAYLSAGQVQLSLAESINSNAAATEWTIKLKKANWHDGKPVTSKDAAYSIRSFGDPKNAPGFASSLADVDFAGIRTPDDQTLVLPLKRARGDFIESVLGQASLVLPEGSSGGATAVGSGPFKMAAAEVGKSVRLVRNDDYWGSKPLLDELEIVTIDDATARMNALKGGQVEYAHGISLAAAQAEAANKNLKVQRSGVGIATAHLFAANVAVPPFNNPNALRALKLAVDRKALVNTVLYGYGEVGNDVVGKGLPGYNTSLPQIERNVAEAKQLFSKAGVTELKMRTGEFVSGATAAAQLLVSQLAECGVKLTLESLPGDQYFSDYQALFDAPLKSMYFINRPPLTHLATYTGSKAGFNITKVGNPDYDAKVAAAQANPDATSRKKQVDELQAYLHENDGLVIWGFQENVHAHTPKLTGIAVSQSVPRFIAASLSG